MNLKRIFNELKKYSPEVFFNRKKTYVYVAMGDSSVEGMGATKPERSYTGIIYTALKEKRNSVEYHNLGKAFASIRDVVDSQLDKAISLNPDLITLSVGANDVPKRTQLLQFEKDLNYLFNRLKNETTAEIIINTIPDMSYTPFLKDKLHLRTLSKVLVWRLNQKIKKQAEKAHIYVIDLYEQSKIFLKNYPEGVSEDGFHPSDFGYALWANIILMQIPHILLQPKHKFRFW